MPALAGGLGARTPDCSITGNITAEPNSELPGLGDWHYTLVASWDTGTNFALSHLDLLMGAEDRCTCDELGSAPAGESDSEDPDCMVPFAMDFECNGGPSLGIGEPLFKFEYDEEVDCEPANVGTLAIDFYSDYPPVDIYTPNMFLVHKFAGLSCAGQIGGVFPSLPCNPLPGEEMPWGAVKSAYVH